MRMVQQDCIKNCDGAPLPSVMLNVAIGNIEGGKMSNSKYPACEALDPCFEIMMKGLSKYVDGEHYFDTLADDVVFEFLYEFPGWPRETRGRENLIALYSGYGRNIRLDRGDALLVHPSDNGRVSARHRSSIRRKHPREDFSDAWLSGKHACAGFFPSQGRVIQTRPSRVQARN